MDIYVLDQNFNRIDLIERFTSFIWTERYRGTGDFKLVVLTTDRHYDVFRTGRYVHILESDYLMMIHSVEKRDNNPDQDTIEVTGETVECLFKQRMVTPNSSGTPWVRTGTPEHIATDLVRRICIDGTGASSYDVIPNLYYSERTLSDFEAEVEVKSGSLYDALISLCEMNNLGFYIHYGPNSNAFNFRVYTGTDRSSSAVSNPVVFSPEHDTIHSTRYLRTNLEFKNTAYVHHPDLSGYEIVYRRGHPSVQGLNRRVMLVDASDIENPTTSKLIQRGRTELDAHPYKEKIDGEVPVSVNSLNYKASYFMGDIVEFRTGNGPSSKVMVTEHTWIHDQTGMRSYPGFDALTD